MVAGPTLWSALPLYGEIGEIDPRLSDTSPLSKLETSALAPVIIERSSRRPNQSRTITQPHLTGLAITDVLREAEETDLARLTLLEVACPKSR